MDASTHFHNPAPPMVLPPSSPLGPQKNNTSQEEEAVLSTTRTGKGEKSSINNPNSLWGSSKKPSFEEAPVDTFSQHAQLFAALRTKLIKYETMRINEGDVRYSWIACCRPANEFTKAQKLDAVRYVINLLDPNTSPPTKTDIHLAALENKRLGKIMKKAVDKGKFGTVNNLCEELWKYSIYNNKNRRKKNKKTFG